MSLCMRKPTICIGENKDADQLRGNREADQRLCFRYSDSTIPPLLNTKISSFQLFSMLVQAGLCQTWSEPKLLVFSRTGSCNNSRSVNTKKGNNLRKIGRVSSTVKSSILSGTRLYRCNGCVGLQLNGGGVSDVILLCDTLEVTKSLHLFFVFLFV